MATRLPKPRPNEGVLRAYTREAARLRYLAEGVTTTRVKTRLLEEAENQDRLAEEAKRDTVEPHARPSDRMHRNTRPDLTT